MKPTQAEVKRALKTLEETAELDGQEPGGPLTIAQALDVVFRAEPAQLYEAGLDYGEAPGKET